jgi:hypothetical protein
MGMSVANATMSETSYTICWANKDNPVKWGFVDRYDNKFEAQMAVTVLSEYEDPSLLYAVVEEESTPV